MRAKRTIRHFGATLASLLLVSGCGATSQTSLSVGEFVPSEAAPTVLPQGHTFFIPGEHMNFELSLRGVIGGEAVTAIGEPGDVDGRPVVIVRSRIEGAGVISLFKEVRDDVSTWIDIDSGRPLKYYADVKFGDKESIIETSFNDGSPGAFEIDYERRGKPRTRYRQRMPADVGAHDVQSALGMLRAWHAEEGEQASVYVLAGKRLWHNAVRLSGRETIRTALGRYPTLRIDGVARRYTRGLKPDEKKKPRQYTVWLSDDANRIPLLVLAKTEYGDVRVELVDYSRPDQRLTAR